MKQLVKKAVFGVLGAVLLCAPATVFAEPLDTDYDAPQFSETLQAPELDQVISDIDQPDFMHAPHLSRDVADPRKELLVSIGHDTAVLEPNAPYEIFLDDTSLGTYESDANGQLFVQVKIPASTTPGPHTLKVSNDSLTLQKPIQFINS